MAKQHYINIRKEIETADIFSRADRVLSEYGLSLNPTDHRTASILKDEVKIGYALRDFDLTLNITSPEDVDTKAVYASLDNEFRDQYEPPTPLPGLEANPIEVYIDGKKVPSIKVRALGEPEGLSIGEMAKLLWNSGRN